MPEIRSDDGRYLLAVQGDGNVVVYDRATPVWDRWSYEAGQTQAPAPPPQQMPVDPMPVDPIPSITSEPVAMPPSSPGRPIRVTTAADGDLVPRMYSYWPNAWVDGNTA